MKSLREIMKGSLGEEDEMRSLKVAVTLENVVEAASLLSCPPI